MANLDRGRRLPKTVVILVGPSEVCVAAPGAVVAAVAAAAAPIPFLICVQGDPSIHRTSVHLSGDDDDDSTAPCYQFGQVRYTHTMVIWVVKFLRRGCKVISIFDSKSTCSMEISVFCEFSGQPSKIGHHFKNFLTTLSVLCLFSKYCNFF